MTENLETLRQAGFFKNFESLTDAELLETLRKRRKEEYSEMFGYDYTPADFSDLTELLLQDDTKFLDIDLEADVLNGNNVYVSVLQDFAKASNGHFNPIEVKEVWSSDEGPIEVSFLSNGEKIVFEPEYLDDWIDGQVFDVINVEMKKVCNETFMFCSGPKDEWFGQNVIHIRLTENEKQLLKEKLNWNFPDQ